MTKRILVKLYLVLVIILVLQPATKAEASNKITVDCDSSSVVVQTLVIALNGVVEEFADSKDSLLILNKNIIMGLDSTTEINRVIEELLVEVSFQSSSLGVGDTNRISNAILDIRGNTDQVVALLEGEVSKEVRIAAEKFTSVSKVINPALGFMVIAIFIFFSISLLLDIGYLIIPVLRLIIEGKKENTKPKIVTREAYTALMEAENESKTAILLIYFKKQLISFIVLSVCLSYFLRDRIFGLLGKILELFSGILPN